MKTFKIAHYWEELCEQRGLLATDIDDPRYISPDEFDYMMRGVNRQREDHEEPEKED